MTARPLRVLFLCTGNAVRSQMAEALLRHLSRGAAEAFSAGTSPANDVHPLTRLVLEQKFGIDTSQLHPKPIQPFVSEQWDFVITVCDRAAESCPRFSDDPLQIHWSFEDPAPIADEGKRRRAFENVATELAARLRIWMALPEVGRRLEARDTAWRG